MKIKAVLNSSESSNTVNLLIKFNGGNLFHSVNPRIHCDHKNRVVLDYNKYFRSMPHCHLQKSKKVDYLITNELNASYSIKACRFRQTFLKNKYS